MTGFSELFCLKEGCGKFALRGLSQCLAREFRPLEVHVAHVNPKNVASILLGGGAGTQLFLLPGEQQHQPDKVAYIRPPLPCIDGRLLFAGIEVILTVMYRFLTQLVIEKQRLQFKFHCLPMFSRVMIMRKGGTGGLFAQKTLEITDDILSTYKNQGGYDLLGRTKDQIRTTEQVNAALASCKALNLDGLLIIRGVPSNTDAAQLAETFAEAKCSTKVPGPDSMCIVLFFSLWSNGTYLKTNVLSLLDNFQSHSNLCGDKCNSTYLIN